MRQPRGRKMLDKDAADVELRVILDVVKELRDAIFEAVSIGTPPAAV
jgi:hypothetical protein